LSLPQVIISIPLFLVLLFGIGFILNMILKTTWLPSYLYAALIIGLAGYMFVERRFEAGGLDHPLRGHDRGAVERLDHQDVARQGIPHVLSGIPFFLLDPEVVFSGPVPAEGSVRVGRGEHLRIQ